MEDQPQKPPFAKRLLCSLAVLMLRACRWRAEGGLPSAPRYVIIVTHTSNWDFVLGIATFAVLSRGFSEVEFSWLGKKELFRWPLGPILRWMGGIPVDRSARHGVVGQMVELYGRRERLAVAMSPEGSRRRENGWRTGFYYIAHGARVPIACGYLDYRRRAAGIGLTLMPSGDLEADLDLIRDFYSRVTARFPDQVSDIRVRPRNGGQKSDR